MNLLKNVHESWIPLLHSLAYKEPLVTFLDTLSDMSFQPEVSKIFRVFEMPLKDIKVVVLGQEPYPIPGISNGLAYGVKAGEKEPKILLNIRKEIVALTPGEEKENWGTLEHLEEQGIFLLNTALTVKTGSAGSHKKYWRAFTEAVISFISKSSPCVWLLWGRDANSYHTRIQNPFIVKGYNRDTMEEIPIDPTLNYIIRGFSPTVMELEKVDSFSSDGFYRTNKILQKKNLEQINW